MTVHPRRRLGFNWLPPETRAPLQGLFQDAPVVKRRSEDTFSLRELVGLRRALGHTPAPLRQAWTFAVQTFREFPISLPPTPHELREVLLGIQSQEPQSKDLLHVVRAILKCDDDEALSWRAERPQLWTEAAAPQVDDEAIERASLLDPENESGSDIRRFRAALSGDVRAIRELEAGRCEQRMSGLLCLELAGQSRQFFMEILRGVRTYGDPEEGDGGCTGDYVASALWKDPEAPEAARATLRAALTGSREDRASSWLSIASAISLLSDHRDEASASAVLDFLTAFLNDDLQESYPDAINIDEALMFASHFPRGAELLRLAAVIPSDQQRVAIRLMAGRSEERSLLLGILNDPMLHQAATESDKADDTAADALTEALYALMHDPGAIGETLQALMLAEGTCKMGFTPGLEAPRSEPLNVALVRGALHEVGDGAIPFLWAAAREPALPQPVRSLALLELVDRLIAPQDLPASLKTLG